MPQNRASLMGTSVLVLAAIGLHPAAPASGWTGPAPVATTTQDSLDPRLAVDSAGKACVVWRERTGGSNFQIWYTTNAGGAFALPVQISQGGSPQCYAPVVVVSGTDVHTAWTSDQAGTNNFEIWYRKNAEGTWGPILNASNTSIKSLRPNMAIGDGVGPVVVWDEALYADDNYDTFFAEWTGSAFSAALNISNTAGGPVYGSTNVNVVVAPNGDVTAAWADRITGDYHVNARRRVGGVWHPRQEISTIAIGPTTPGMVVGSDSRVHVVYSSGDAIWYQQWNGSAWTAASSLPGGLPSPLRPRIAIDANGVLHVVCDNQNEIYYTTNFGGPWNGWVNISNLPGTQSINADIGCGGGLLTVTWQENSNGAGGTGVFNTWYTTAPAPTAGPTGTIAGTVRDAFGCPVAGAVVAAGPYQGTSGPNGTYWLTGVAVGTYSASATRAYFAGQTVNGVTVNANQTTTLDFTITSLPPEPLAWFRATPSSTTNTLRWQNPASGNFGGTTIRYKTTGYPTGPTDGELVVELPGSPSDTQRHDHAGLVVGLTYYYAAFAHDDRPVWTYAAGANAAAMPSGPADFDGDGDVDLGDFSLFQMCFNGPNTPPALPGCAAPDVDADGDVDLSDFAVFQACFNGPNRTPVPGCAH